MICVSKFPIPTGVNSRTFSDNACQLRWIPGAFASGCVRIVPWHAAIRIATPIRVGRRCSRISRRERSHHPRDDPRWSSDRLPQWPQVGASGPERDSREDDRVRNIRAGTCSAVRCPNTPGRCNPDPQLDLNPVPAVVRLTEPGHLAGDLQPRRHSPPRVVLMRAWDGRTPSASPSPRCAPTDRIGADRQAMLALPPMPPATG